jgi:hypothetical protein
MAHDPSLHPQTSSAPWTPELHFRADCGRCRLALGSYAYGDGKNLQEAADDLIARLLTFAKHFRSGSGFTVTAALLPIDFRWFEFLYELGEIAERGEDIRPRVFGSAANSATPS